MPRGGMSHAEGTAGADVLKQALPFVPETSGTGESSRG